MIMFSHVLIKVSFEGEKGGHVQSLKRHVKNSIAFILFYEDMIKLIVLP